MMPRSWAAVKGRNGPGRRQDALGTTIAGRPRLGYAPKVIGDLTPAGVIPGRLALNLGVGEMEGVDDEPGQGHVPFGRQGVEAIDFTEGQRPGDAGLRFSGRAPGRLGLRHRRILRARVGEILRRQRSAESDREALQTQHAAAGRDDGRPERVAEGVGIFANGDGVDAAVQAVPATTPGRGAGEHLPHVPLGDAEPFPLRPLAHEGHERGATPTGPTPGPDLDLVEDVGEPTACLRRQRERVARLVDARGDGVCDRVRML
jgi:hypothetical protein